MVIQPACAKITGPGRYQGFCKRLERRKGAGEAEVAEARERALEEAERALWMTRAEYLREMME